MKASIKPTHIRVTTDTWLQVQDTQQTRFEPQPANKRRGANKADKTRWQQFKSFVYHRANALAPKGRRTEQKTRTFQKAVRQLVDAMSATPPASTALIAQHLDRIAQANQLLTGKPGTLTAEMTKALVEKLPELPLDQLKQLRQQADAAREQAGLDGARRHDLRTIADQAYAECVERLRSDLDDLTFAQAPQAKENMDRLLRDIDKALEADADDVQEIQFRLDSVQGQGAKLLTHYGLVRPGDDAFEQSWGLLKDICAQLNRQGKAYPDDLRQLFLVMPPATQAKLLAAKNSRMPQTTSDIDALLIQAVAQKFHDIGRDFRQACKGFHATGANSPHQLARQAQQLHAALDRWHALQAHGDAHGKALGLKVSEADSAAFAQIKLAAARLDLSRLDRETLSDSALHSLAQTLGGLGIDKDLPRLQQEIAQRKRQSTIPYTRALSDALQRLSRGDTAGALRALRTANGCVAELLAVHKALGERCKDFEDRTRILRGVSAELFHAQSPETLERWFGALGADDTQRQAAQLRSAGPANEADYQLGQDLKDLHEQLAELQPQSMDQGTQEAMAAVLQAITQQVQDEPMPAAWNSSTREAMQNALELSAPQHIDAITRLLDASIAHGMKDTTYVLVQEGQPDQGLTKSSALRDTLAPTPAQYRGLARLANTDLWTSAAVHKALASSERTPLRSTDGAPLRFEDPQTNNRVRIAKGSQGDLTVSIEQVQSQPRRAVNMDTGEAVAIDTGNSQLRLLVSLTIHPDGSMTMATPVSCQSRVEPASA